VVCEGFVACPRRGVSSQHSPRSTSTLLQTFLQLSGTAITACAAAGAALVWLLGTCMLRHCSAQLPSPSQEYMQERGVNVAQPAPKGISGGYGKSLRACHSQTILQGGNKQRDSKLLLPDGKWDNTQMCSCLDKIGNLPVHIS